MRGVRHGERIESACEECADDWRMELLCLVSVPTLWSLGLKTVCVGALLKLL